MPNDNESCRFPVRKNPGLDAFDYSSRNYYFVTICTRNKRCLFGSPTSLSELGGIAADCLEKITSHFSEIRVDKWVVMPNHIHAIIIMPGKDTTLSTVIGQYKAAVTKKIHALHHGINVWQNSFHDHIIRNQADY